MKKYQLIAYHSGNVIRTFETDDYLEARRFYAGARESTAIRCLLDGNKLTYPESDRLFGLAVDLTCRRRGDGKQNV